ncbi:hypothetical protein B566_EDAN001800 [Ephemera danica]|nr:hypothetical protein B566_EDAN001800 [Ephemera danica]
MVSETHGAHHSWGAGVHFLTSEAAAVESAAEVIVPPPRGYRSRSVIIKAEDGGYHAALLKAEDEGPVDEDDDPGLYLHGNTTVGSSAGSTGGCPDDELPLAKHELLEYVIQHDGSVICKWCGDTLPSRTHWYRHKYRVHAVNLYKCTKCNMFFKTKKGYIGHISNRHGNDEDDRTGHGDEYEEEQLMRQRCYNTETEELPEQEQPVASPSPPTPVLPPPAPTSVLPIVSRATRDSEWELERQREERLVAEIIDRVRRECEAQGTSTLSRRRYTRRSTVMNS